MLSMVYAKCVHVNEWIECSECMVFSLQRPSLSLTVNDSCEPRAASSFIVNTKKNQNYANSIWIEPWALNWMKERETAAYPMWQQQVQINSWDRSIVSYAIHLFSFVVFFLLLWDSFFLFSLSLCLWLLLALLLLWLELL